MDYGSLNHKQLKEMSKKEGLPTKGNKQELIDGLEKLRKPENAVVGASASKIDSAAEPAVAVVVTPLPDVVEPPAMVVSDSALCSEMAQQAAVPVASALRASSRVSRPRICTMCVGCSHHPVRIAMKKPAVTEDKSIGELTEKLASVNIKISRERKVTVDQAAKPTKISKPRSAAATTRAPLKAKPNQATGDSTCVAHDDAKQTKASKSTETTKKIGSMKHLAAVGGKENLPSQLEAAVTTERPGRKLRSLKQVTA
ncbi:hypothetical protein MPTK1_1g28360 [Marchantia polymorpha subsp. ruderalis]|uniref:SAP domain-containing protein n=2 Tax=Marchantia polymorpha TaxID=3197 RepID=A0AAF6AV70_MARPO|nr:hypothetical protein MARPO_0002s0043 [Marchantia polymorpha]BBN00341.1 hypothetical protein Mp_1g28360 [Marchantia polymorpha subsp. ruderalis]|eukprot:PTQ49541.1 hypothetical protein MARPO_0002s0043 [Marchantia polymorpha]